MKHTNERSCITALFLKTSEANDPQCKEDDNVALLCPFRRMFAAVVRASAYMIRQNFQFLPQLRFNPSYAPVHTLRKRLPLGKCLTLGNGAPVSVSL